VSGKIEFLGEIQKRKASGKTSKYEHRQNCGKKAANKRRIENLSKPNRVIGMEGLPQ